MAVNGQANSSFFSVQSVKDFLQKTYVDQQPPGVRTPASAATSTQSATTNSNSAPQKADAAPTPQSITVFSGICDALNEFQKKLVEIGEYEVADVYEIQFAPQTIASSSIAIKGTTEYKATPMANSKTPNAANSATDTVDMTGRAVQIVAGTQLVQFIDQVMRSSEYITKQANVTISEKDGTVTPKPVNNGSSTAPVQWYKMSFQAEQLKFDKKRNDYAYKMIFIINSYALTDLESQFFSKPNFRGAHKAYNYWFTGQNTEIINFEQEYNNNFYTSLISTPKGDKNPAIAKLTNTVDPSTNLPGPKRGYTGGFNVSSQYADSGANKIGGSAADYLYSLSPQATARLNIVGDPAWLQQGELTNTVSAQNLSFSPFNPDGTINFESGQVVFSLAFNRPGDYNYDTGIVEVKKQNYNKDGSLATLQPQAKIYYTATSVKSYFSHGKFTQELEGRVYNVTEQFGVNAKSDASLREGTSATGTVANDTTQPGTRDPSVSVAGTTTTTPVSPTSSTQAAVGPINNPATQPAPPAEPVTSNGSTVGAPNVVNDVQVASTPTQQMASKDA